MQLKNKVSLAEKLALAAAALIGTTVNAEAVDEEWKFVGSVLAYSEPDRVSALETIITAQKTYDDTAVLTYKVVLDSLTGASANGAISQNNIQTFTRPSGNGQYVIQANDTPLDDTFKDTRAQINVNWSDVFANDMRYSIGTNLSKEYDYQSLTLNGEISKDFDRKNTNLSVGLSFASDTINPEGNRPLAFSSMVVDAGQFANDQAYRDAFNQTRISGDGSVDTTELLLGWTQIVNRKMILQFNYGYADASGYLTDPFKILSVIDNNAVAQDYLYESRPESKQQHSLFGMMKYHLDDSVIDASYRFVTDDWNIDSHTIDLKWHAFSGNDTFWEPHFRYYQQTAADFYAPYLVQGDATPEFASADYRIGEMSTVTVGLKYGFPMFDSRAELRAEYYQQTPTAPATERVAAADALDLYPKVDAFMLQFTYFFN